jgi:hypothetical protein
MRDVAWLPLAILVLAWPSLAAAPEAGDPASLPSAAPATAAAQVAEVSSPDRRIRVRIAVDAGSPRYSVQLDGRDVLAPSPLGLRRGDADFTTALSLAGATPVERVKDDYLLLHGKRRRVRYLANRRVFEFANQAGHTLEVAFQVSNDGVAFRYRFPKLPLPETTVESEETGFAFPPGTTAWLHPMHDAKTGWSRVNPCYEEHYAAGVAAGTPSPHAAGWAFPALFRVGDDTWVLVTESDVDDGYCAARLREHAPGGLYRIGFPQAGEHRGEADPVAPTIRTPFASPWRVIVVGETLRPVVESTLVTDVARPTALKDASFVAPGRAAWSWLQLDDPSCRPPVQKEFLELASRLGWEYLLVDSMWDKQIGWDGIEELVRLGRERNVGIWLWYNSNGSFNDAPMTPKDRMHEPAARREEMARLQRAGIRGVKVDFMGGDKQATMKLYLDILKDAADHRIMVNFHGATIPRGWERTYPHLMTMEAVKGMEFVGFEQVNADRQPGHCAILPFTRNAIGPMDFTPTVFNRKMRRIDRRTGDAFELALAVLFESGVQHLGLTPAEVESAPAFVRQMLKSIPPAWDDVRLVAGFPGREAVLARRSGDTWFVAGINGGAEPRPLTLDLPFLGGALHGALVTDGPEREGFAQRTLAGEPSRRFAITLPAGGGFLMRVERR